MNAKSKIQNLQWQTKLIVILVLSSMLLYSINIIIFKDGFSFLEKFLSSLAFVPIQVLLVSVIVAQFMKRQEKIERDQKLNMVIGAFFSEVGNELLKNFYLMDFELKRHAQDLIPTPNWTGNDYNILLQNIRNFKGEIQINNAQLESLKELLLNKRNFLLNLLENPNLLENEHFTELLWAVFHLMEELDHRQNINLLSAVDLDHLVGDIQRADQTLLREWILYLEHLENKYPFLFSLALRINPFNPNAKVELE